MITTFYPPYNFGGDGLFVQRLSNELALRGHSVDVIHCIDAYRTLACGEPVKTDDDHPNVTVHGLKSPFGFLSPLATQQTGFPLFKSRRIRRIMEKRFDVIHYHNISLIGGPKILEYGQGIKLYTLHDFWLVCPSHVMFRFNRAACFNPNCIPCLLIHKRPPQFWRYFSLLSRKLDHVDALISPSRSCRDNHFRMGLKAPIMYLPNFTSSDESGLALRDPSIGDMLGKPYFLFVGRLEKLKGLQTLITVFRHYNKARLLIAGVGRYERRLLRLAGDSHNIRFLGYMPKLRLDALYRQASALIVPSLCPEIFSLVLIEAFSKRTPAIVRNLGGMRELILESGGGFVYDTEDQLISAMDRVLDDASSRRDRGDRGYLTYKQKWTVEAHLKRYFKLIRGITANSDSV